MTIAKARAIDDGDNVLILGRVGGQDGFVKNHIMAVTVCSCGFGEVLGRRPHKYGSLITISNEKLEGRRHRRVIYHGAHFVYESWYYKEVGTNGLVNETSPWDEAIDDWLTSHFGQYPDTKLYLYFEKEDFPEGIFP